ncbi:RING finger protein B [Acropora cervicornis]|uniref:RING finger protein B n=1 Tax=Acropora cervicornis TaxID=6130 RepID=A0AAD9Q6D6_ACRCE|nr:RING finger protein B [Acropora cervicornis]
MRSLIFLACVLMLVRLVASENEGKSISHQWKPSPQSFYDALFYLLEFVRSVACFFGNLVSALYFLLHAIVIASCELISSIFSYVKHAIKLLEFLVVSAWNTSPQLLELLYSIMGSIFLGIEYLGKSIITFSTSVCNQLISISKLLFYRIQTLLSAFGQNTLTLLNAIFWAISETFSTLITCSTSIYNQLIPISKSLLYNIQVLLRVFGQNILTMLNVVFWAISETFSTLITWSSSVCNQMILFSKWLLCGIQAFLCAIGQNTLTMLNAILWAISETFSTLITCSTSICNQLIPFSKWLLCGIQALLSAIGQNTLNMLNAILWAMSEMSGTLLTCSTSVYNQLIPFSKWLLCGIQALLCAIGQNTLTLLNAIFWAISETFSTLIMCSTSIYNQLIPISKSLLYNIQVLLRVFGQNILTMLNVVFWAISETFSTLITWSSSVCNQMIPFSKWLLCGIQAFLCAIGQNTLTMLNAILWAISETFSTLITCSTSICNQLIPFSKWLLCGIQALLSAIGQNTLNMLNAILWAMSEMSGTLITCSTSVYNQLIPFSKWLLCGIQALLCAIGQNTLTLLNAISWGISEMFGRLITCSTSVYNQLIPFSKWLLYSIQALLCAIGQNTWTTLNAIFWAISETSGTLITCSTSVYNQLILFSKWLLYGIQALLCAIGQNTWTTLNAIFWAISETSGTLITCSTSVYNQLILFSKWLLYGIQALLCAIGQNTLTMLNTIFRAIGETFSTLIMCSSSVCNQLTLFSKWLLYSIQALLFVFGENMLNVLNTIFWATSVIFSPFITELGRRYIKCIENLPDVASLALHYSLNIGRWTVMILALVGSFLIYCCVGVNVFSMTFKLLKTSLQGALAFFASFEVTSFPRQEKTTGEHEEPGHVPKDDRYLALMEQLERERDQKLCIVCLTEMKNIVLMPCRHMCLCKNCCKQLMEVHGKRSCPLCCQSIASTLEIYT